MKSWKATKAKITPTSSFLIKHMGFYLIAASVINLSVLVKDASPVQAAGYNAVIWACMHAYFLVTGEYKKLSMPEAPMVAWLLLHSTVAYAALA